MVYPSVFHTSQSAVASIYGTSNLSEVRLVSVMLEFYFDRELRALKKKSVSLPINKKI